MKPHGSRLITLARILLLGTGVASAADEAQLQKVIDRMEIEELMWRYVPVDGKWLIQWADVRPDE